MKYINHLSDILKEKIWIREYSYFNFNKFPKVAYIIDNTDYFQTLENLWVSDYIAYHHFYSTPSICKPHIIANFINYRLFEYVYIYIYNYMYIIICIFDIKHAACFESTVHYARLPVLTHKLHNSHFTVM